ncbi:biosynthetic-type acetolactate synthase large subunit [Methanosphaera sp. BMS]|uniref:biosynthetic-type acetolactate synthase large subunit n=1 Tax=Methanosphaera sp. BMS TaxID=1789762 RepID=UPI000DC1E34A|nr:biosynthetic-type acetolactate synthase large subunit [Methanosphaera sp. BMS]AWX32895.1 acetolactate synthase catalytic subunit [Methanosphaera sp. BMS]MDO5825673.1 biosynthetic-type acetolactate synthase large subunit [Methanosphaera sp.]
MKGSKLLIDKLKENGVDTIFGYPGGVLLPFYDALCESDINHILVRHEQAAAHAADGYARASGRVGVCLATSGPGATNVTTGVATANMDSSPVVVLTGQVPTAAIGTDMFQEVDTIGITMPISKHNFQPRSPKRIAEDIDKAFYIASTGRPGPVVIDLPRNVLEEEIDISSLTINTDIPGYKPTKKGNLKQIKKAINVINQSKKPIIVAGGGAILSDCGKQLYEFAKLANIPIATTLMGKGIISEYDELSLGMIGMHGIQTTNRALTECDCLIAVGCRFSDRSVSNATKFAPNATIIQIDVDPAEIGKTIHVDIPIVGDAKITLEEFINQMDKTDNANWTKELIAKKRDNEENISYTQIPLKPQECIKEIMEAVTADTIVTTDVGQNQMWMAHYYKTRNPRTFISSGGLGTMGFGLPAAMGAQFAKPDANVLAICGDGGFAMVSQELATIKENDLPVVVCILNNRYLGMVAQLQKLFNDHVYATKLTATPDFVKLADAYGIEGQRVEKVGQLRESIENAFKSREATLIDVAIDREELLPIVPPGQSLDKMKMTFDEE